MPNTINFKTIKLERTMCYGSCPVYKLSIHHKGRLTYTGKHFVEKVGTLISTLDHKTLLKLNKALEKSDYFNLVQEQPLEMCTDMAYCITTVEMLDGTKRKIEHYLQDDDDGWPRQLPIFEKAVDKIIGIKDYIGKGGELGLME